jgi:hypothetical protein
MAQNYRDPLTYLNETVTKRGKSGPDGVYLYNVTVVAEAASDYNYRVSYGNPVRPTVPPEGLDWVEWASLLISLRSDVRTLSHELLFSTDKSVWQFLPEGNSLSMNVFLPVTDISIFPYLLKQAQDTLICAADFATKVPDSIRFNIGVVTKSWVDMAEQGEVKEMDLSY